MDPIDYSRPLKPQWIFDHVVKGIIQQGRPGQRTVTLGDGSSRVFCALRGDDGARCAVGLLLPDRVISGVLVVEDLPLDQVIRDHLLPLFPAAGRHYVDVYDLIEQLRQAHDGASYEMRKSNSDTAVFVESFIRRVTLIADRFSLSKAKLVDAERAYRARHMPA